ncbi:MAG TPA: dihydrofolate reductase family protein [Longimicrobium sp.]|nr:dihydrofolate reductase family protein [Longimicrobium sp.]
MRRIRYQVAASLDGYIAGPNGEFDWIVTDPEIDFAALFAQFDTFLMGRVTYEGMITHGDWMPKSSRVIVLSRTMRPEDHPGVTILSEGWEDAVRAVREEPSEKDVWIFGGGDVFRSLLQAGLVDTVEIAVVPVLLGGGIPLLPAPAPRARLRLTGHRMYASTGIVMLEYAVEPAKKARGKAKAKG